MIWILHDARYNKPHLSAMELYLKDQPHYFTNMQQNGEGIIYDQFAIIQHSRRLTQLLPLPIDIRRFKQFSIEKNVLQVINDRRRLWNGFFSGDLADLAESELMDGHGYLQKAMELERRYYSRGENGYWHQVKELLYFGIIRPYYLILQLFVERCSK